MSEPFDVEECMRFVQDVELPTDLERSDASVNRSFNINSIGAAAVDGRALVSFVKDVDDQTKEDILFSMLFAALAADAKYSIYTATKQWYELYRSTLQKVAWNTQSFVMGDASVDGFGSVDNLVRHLAKEYLPQNQLATFELSIQGLKDNKNPAASKVFNRMGSSANQAGFHTSLAVMSGGNAVLKVGYHAYSTDQNVTSVLFDVIGNRKVTFSYGSQEMVLNHKLYEKIREAVKKRIVNYVTSFIEDVPLPALP